MVTFDIVNAEKNQSKAIQAEIAKIGSAASGSMNAFAVLFVQLCERFIGKDSQTGDNLAHLLDSLDGCKSLQRAVIAKLNSFSENSLTIEHNATTNKYSVQTVKGADKKSLFKKDKFTAAVEAAKISNPFLENKSKTDEEKAKAKAERERKQIEKYQKSVKEGLAKTQIENELKTYIQTAIEVTDETPETLKIKLSKMIDNLFTEEKPVIEGETQEPETQE
ncbi:TPA: hypothetical protein ACXPQL_004132 [Salmonella enterica]